MLINFADPTNAVNHYDTLPTDSILQSLGQQYTTVSMLINASDILFVFRYDASEH